MVSAGALAALVIIAAAVVLMVHRRHTDAIESKPSAPMTTTRWAPTTAPAEIPTLPTRDTITLPAPSTPTVTPRWDGRCLRNYTEHEGDCAYGLNYWVVQPSNETGMHDLKLGCFPPSMVDEFNSTGHSLRWWTSVRFAVWDKDRIMSDYNRTGDLAMIGLAQSCLTRAGLPDFHEGPIHDDCLVKPQA
ncbi:hypothetical protein A5625_10325 [Mycobacterium sp. 1465703.0]|nr:hypothetical protein A5625_10325 [Mycobacterium sp. 1465703.0]